MGLEQSEQKRGCLSRCGAKRINSLFCYPAICADGKTIHPICDLVETAGLDGMVETDVDLTQLDQMRKTWQRCPPVCDQNDFAVLSGF